LNLGKDIFRPQKVIGGNYNKIVYAKSSRTPTAARRPARRLLRGNWQADFSFVFK
jgi:hypothetical protein